MPPVAIVMVNQLQVKCRMRSLNGNFAGLGVSVFCLELKYSPIDRKETSLKGVGRPDTALLRWLSSIDVEGDEVSHRSSGIAVWYGLKSSIAMGRSIISTIKKCQN
jgi:hypothetical protein